MFFGTRTCIVWICNGICKLQNQEKHTHTDLSKSLLIELNWIQIQVKELIVYFKLS